MSGVQHITVNEDETDMRLDRWFRQHFPNVTHGQLEKFLRKGEVRVDGGRVKSNRRISTGETIRIPPLAPIEKRREDPPQRADVARFFQDATIYEDDALLALNKPFGLAVQGGTKTTQHLDDMIRSLETNDAAPRLVHRLDKDTGGLMLIAKTRRAAVELTAAFRERMVDKTYWALVAGTPAPKAGTIDLPLEKQSIGGQAIMRPVYSKERRGQSATTHYQIVDRAGPVSFLAMQPVTGRTHQLRAHAAAIDTPIVGDKKYGGEKSRIEGVSQKLHLFCRAMQFRHPKTGRVMTLKAPLAGHMLKTWRFFSFNENADVDWPKLP